jgi:Protein of unknown function (DUF3021).
MAHKILKTYVPAVSMAFMFIVLLAGLIKYFTEGYQNEFFSFILEVVVYLVITCIMDELIGRIDLKSYLGHFLLESLLIYPVTLLFCYYCNWFEWSLGNILFYSLIYFCVMIGIHLYFYYVTKSDAVEINSYLR